MTTAETPLEDLMVAMDVVDTLRHKQRMLDHELAGEGRRESLIAQLKEIYAAQGIEVSDEVLEEGVRALEEDRFSYKPAKKGIAHAFARFYIRRRKHAKPLLIFTAFGLFVLLSEYFSDIRPKQKLQKKLPITIVQQYEMIQSLAKTEDAKQQALNLRQQAEASLHSGKLSQAKRYAAQLSELSTTLQSSYKLQVVNRPGERTGVYRIPDINPNARNYYLIVEAIDDSGSKLSISVVDEESSKKEKVAKWGIRVTESAFNSVSADKQDDGIIQNNIVGKKTVGYLKPNYFIDVINTAAITRW